MTCSLSSEYRRIIPRTVYGNLKPCTLGDIFGCLSPGTRFTSYVFVGLYLASVIFVPQAAQISAARYHAPFSSSSMSLCILLVSVSVEHLLHGICMVILSRPYCNVIPDFRFSGISRLVMGF